MRVERVLVIKNIFEETMIFDTTGVDRRNLSIIILPNWIFVDNRNNEMNIKIIPINI